MLVLIAVLLLSIGLLIEFTIDTTVGVLAAVAAFLTILELLQTTGAINLRRS